MTEGKMLMELFPESNITKETKSIEVIYNHLVDEFKEVKEEIFKLYNKPEEFNIKKTFLEIDDLIMMCMQLKYKICDKNKLDKEKIIHHYYKELIRKLEERGTI